MLDQAEISLNIGRLVFWVALTAGAGILGANLFYYQPGVGLLGVALVMVACTVAIQRALGNYHQLLREAFEHGREHGRLQNIQQVRR